MRRTATHEHTQTVVATLLDRRWRTWQVTVQRVHDDTLHPWRVAAHCDGEQVAELDCASRAMRDATAARMIAGIRTA